MAKPQVIATDDDIKKGLQIYEASNYLSAIKFHGRKKNAKTDIFEEIAGYGPRAYYWFSRLFRDTFAHPEHALDINESTVTSALKSAGISLGDGSSLERRIVIDSDESESMHRSLNTTMRGIITAKRCTSEDRKRNVLKGLFDDSYDPAIIVKALGFGASYWVYDENIIEGALRRYKSREHSMAVDERELKKYANRIGDAPYAAYQILRLASKHDEYDYMTTRLRPHDPLVPMKAKSEFDTDDLGSFDENLATGVEPIAQTKYDGGRVLFHDDGATAALYTSSGKNVLDVMPQPAVATRDKYDSIILDGEAVPYNNETGELLDFQHILKRIGRETVPDDSTVDVRYRWFDVLYHNGTDLTEIPLSNRMTALRRTVEPSQLARTGTDPEAVYEQAIANGHEGIIAKTDNSEYQFDERPSTWQKIKAEPMECDAMIAEVAEGEGRLDGTLGALHLALPRETVPATTHTSIGSVGTGFTDAVRDELWAMYESGSLLSKTVQVSFEEVQIDADGMVSLRFPRFDALRPDGEPDTLDRLCTEIADTDVDASEIR
jgi:ATP-dependent DNA ligase